MYYLFCVVLCFVCVYMCPVLLPPGGYPITVNKYIISISRQSAHEYRKVVSPIPPTTFARQEKYLVLSRTEGHSAAVRIKSIKETVTSSYLRPRGLQRSVSTNCAIACPKIPDWALKCRSILVGSILCLVYKVFVLRWIV
jgi:hypothetical protein